MNIPTETATFLNYVLVALVGFAIGQFVKIGRQEIPAVIEAAEMKLGTDKWTMFKEMALWAVRAAHRARVDELIENSGKAAFDYAVAKLKAWLAANDLEEIDVDALVALIQGAYDQLETELKKDLPELADALSDSATAVQ